MSILIRDMEMPKNCFYCACASYYERLDKAMCDLTNKQLDQKVWKKERHPNCPLIELPFAEELAEKLYKQIEKAVIEGSETDA